MSKQKGKLKLCVYFNRDEYIDREAEKLQAHGDILCGKDKETGTSWLAYNKKTRRIAFLTNYRASTPNIPDVGENPPSRGELIMNWVKTDISREEYTQDVFSKLQDYRGFNLIFGIVDDEVFEITPDNAEELLQDNPRGSYLYHISNGNPEIVESQKPIFIQPGILYGMSNGNISEWEKVELGTNLINQSLDDFEALSETQSDNDEEEKEPSDAQDSISEHLKLDNYSKHCIDKILCSKQRSYPWNLPETGKALFFEWLSSSLFVQFKIGKKFCTVSSSVLLISSEDLGLFRERTYAHESGFLKSFFQEPSLGSQDVVLKFIHENR
ncbi:unnamed protein product [Moneuplotes crassus]|uniref:Uncharacterized protein n=1 Tax=Euplotes crassus TaxID=5936 RepID=A0AAD2CXT2_EUPCR|nr:unnamed protein product [Moneuplotes crassus]